MGIGRGLAAHTEKECCSSSWKKAAQVPQTDLWRRGCTLRDAMADTDELATMRKELQSVKARAVGKIKALQAQVRLPSLHPNRCHVLW